MHIFVFIKYLPSTDMRSTNTRFYALPGFVRNTSNFKTMDYHVSRYHDDCLLLKITSHLTTFWMVVSVTRHDWVT